MERELNFPEEVRTWLAEHVSPEPRPHGDGPESRAFDLAWQRGQYDGGWAGMSWPAEYGGRGLSTIERLIWYEEYARANDLQKAFHRPRILRGDVVWCQGFSEPEAALAVSVEYARQRGQFGRPIGVNQAIKHRCADMAVRCEGAFAQATRLNIEGAVQIHGAMGFTNEATPHRYVNRGHLLAPCLADRAALLDRSVGRVCATSAVEP